MSQRMTPIRDDVMNLLRQSHLLSVSELVDRLRSKYPDVNKTTVYRATEFLLGQNLICQHQFGADEARYELREDHAHGVCTSCGKVIELECDHPTPPQTSKFNFDHHHLTFFGRCQQCLEKED